MASPIDEWHNVTRLNLLTLKQSLNLELPKKDWLIPSFIPTSDTIAVMAAPEIETQPLAHLIAYCIAGGKNFDPFGQGAGVTVLFCSGNGDPHEDKSLQELISQRDPHQSSRDRASQNLHIYQREYQDDLPIFIDTHEGQNALRNSIPKGCQLVVFDNKQAWFKGKFSKRDDMAKVSPWLSALNRDGIAVLFFEHATKNRANTNELVRKPSNIIQLTTDPAAPTGIGGGFNIVRKKTDVNDKVPSMFQFWYKVVDGKFDFGWEFRDLSNATVTKQIEMNLRQMQVELLLAEDKQQKEIAEILKVDAATICRDAAALRARKKGSAATPIGSPMAKIDLDSGEAYWADV